MPQISTTHYPHRVAHFSMLVAFLFLCPATVAAVSIVEYQRSLKTSIEELEAIIELEDESDVDFQSRLSLAIESIRAALPERQTVESGADACNVDNSWLHRDLNEIKQLSVSDQLERIGLLLQTLQAIEQRVAERQTPGQLVDSKEQAKSRLESILARPEYATGARGTNALTRLLQDFFRWLAKILPKPKAMEPGRAKWLSLIAQIVVVLVALLVIFYVIKILLTRFRRPRQRKSSKKKQARIVLGERLEPEQTGTDLLFEAEALARRGDLRAAIRKAYIALLVELGDRKLISLAQHKTNRDYLNSVSGLPQLHSRMRGLTDSFERHWYGFAEATPNDWQDFRAGYLAALHKGN